MKLAGMGLIFSRGLGVAALEKALQEGWRKPDEIKAPWRMNGAMPMYEVNLDAVPDKGLLKKIRRADKLSKMSVLAAADALVDSGIGDIAQYRIGVILATAFGAHVTTFSFLDDILNYGDGAVSPTTFSNSVHNAAASYVSSSLAVKGPTLTVTQFQFSFETALQLAQAWLDQNRCDYVLLGAADECGEILAYISDVKLTTAKDGRIQPFVFRNAGHVPGEGAVFFLLGKENISGAYCSVAALWRNDMGKSPDLDIIHANGMMPDETVYQAGLVPGIPVAAYAPIFGSMMISSAFNVASAALMLKLRTVYANPVKDNPHNLLLITQTEEADLTAIRCAGYNCNGEKSLVMLRRE